MLKSSVPVSMRLNALVVQPSEFLPCAQVQQNYGGLTHIPLGMQVESMPFQEGNSLQAGVHLHWLLPESFTAGEQLPDGTLRYFPVPDRFLVTRIWSVGNEAPQYKQWLVYSDSLSRCFIHGSREYPEPVEGGFCRAYLGKAVAYPGGQPPTQFMDQPLTAIMPGDPCFAAYYPGCRNAFGLYDDLNGVPFGAHLSYLVCGWRQAQPENTLCAGKVLGLKWDDSPQNGKHPDGLPKIAVGETTSEAMAAFYQSPILFPMMEGMLRDGEQPGEQREMAYALHRKGFSIHSSGYFYQLDGEESGQFTDLLAYVNRLLEREQRLIDICAGLRQRIYLYWYLETSDYYSPLPPENLWYADVFKKEKRRLGHFILHLEQMRKRRIQCETALKEKVSDEMQLKQVSQPRYWSAIDPVVLLKDSGRAGSPEMLQKRAANQKFSFLPADCALPAGVSYPPELEGYFPPLFAGVLDAHRKQGQDPVDPAPWSPLYLEWRVSFTPWLSEDQLHPLNGWKLDGLDWVLDGVKPSAPIPLSGRTVLSGHGPQILSEALQYRAKQSPFGDRLLQTAVRAEEEDLLSQQLSGFHEPFLAHEPGLLLPPFDWGERQKYTHQIAEMVQDCNTAAPAVTRKLRPVRAGGYTLQEIRLIDSYGRFWPVPELNQVSVPERFQPPKGMDAQVFAPPRLVHPSRLRLRWYSCDEMRILASQTGESPVFGWLVPSLADHSLMVYGSDGSMAGIFRNFTENGCHTVVWEEAPGGLPVPLAVQPLLQAFIQGFLAMHTAGEDSIQAFIDCMERTPGAGLFPRDAHLSLYEGRVFALAACGLRLESFGVPPVPMEMGDSQPPFSHKVYPVQLGDPDHPADGLCGFYDLDDAGFTIFQSPYASGKGGFISSNNLTNVRYSLGYKRLVLLFDPLCPFHLISGYLPVLTIRLDPDMVQKVERALYAAMQVAPVLSGSVPPKLPLDLQEGRVWQWMERSIPGTWSPPVVPGNASSNAWESLGPQQVREGWLVLKANPDQKQKNG